MDIAALKKEAKSKKTIASRLLELAKNPDPTVQYTVASNPNAPLAALEIRLWEAALHVLSGLFL